jgi:hypothetical protein
MESNREDEKMKGFVEGKKLVEEKERRKKGPRAHLVMK